MMSMVGAIDICGVANRTPIDVNSDGHVTVAGIQPEVLREQYGSPLFVLDSSRLRMNCEEFISAFQSQDFPVGIHYAVKANSNVEILSRIRHEVAFAEVNSPGEIIAARQAGFQSENLIMHGNAKSDEELKYAVSHNMFLIVSDSMGELRRINAIAKSVGKQADVAVRVSFDVEINSPWKAGSMGSKFGISDTEAMEVFVAAQTLHNIRIVGLHSHIGSQVVSVNPYINLVKRMGCLYRNILSKGWDIKIIDIGGGFPVNYQFGKNREQELSMLSTNIPIAEMASQIIETFKNQFEIKNSTKHPSLLVEPGRCIVASAGVLLTTVQEVKETRGQNWVAVDAGCHNLPDCWLYNWYFECVPCKLLQGKRHLIQCHVAGPLCDSNDVIARDRLLPVQKNGDILLFLQVGAYQVEQQNSFNLRPTARVVLLENGTTKLIQEKHTMLKSFRPCIVDEQFDD